MFVNSTNIFPITYMQVGMLYHLGDGNFKLNSLLYVLASPRFRANLKADLF